MRKLATLTLALVLVAALLPFGTHAQAQGGGALQLDTWVEGEISNAQYEQSYTFTATAGQVLIVEMQATGEQMLDPYLILKDAAGNMLAENDDANGLDSVVVYPVAADQEITVLATRALQADGSSEGTYQVGVHEASVLAVGSEATTTIAVVEGDSVATNYVLHPEASSTVAFGFSQTGGELFAGFEITRLSDETTILAIDNTMGVRSGTLNIDLDGGEYYLVTVEQALYSWVWEDMSIDVTISLGEAK